MYKRQSYYFSTLTKEQATIFQRNSSVILGLYALADMGIHYDGWKLADAAAFFHTYGITDDATIEDIYDPVSYTHLDVYKRQVMANPVSV